MLRHRIPNDVRSGCGQSGAATHVRYTYPVSFYLDAYRSYRAAADSVRDGAHSDPFEVLNQLPERRARVKIAIASKGKDAIPFVLQMLRSNDHEEREDARGVIALMTTDGRMVDSLIETVARVTDSDTLTTIVIALGARSIPCLARILAAPGIDAATTRAVVVSLGALTNSQFEINDDPRSSALDWLELNGYRSVPIESDVPLASPPENSTPPGDLVNIQSHAPRTDETLKVVAASVDETCE